MSKRMFGVLGATLILFSLSLVVLGQKPTTTTTVTKTEAIQNADGTYTIVEYPVGKETTVTLNPVGLSGSTGTATILRAADGTTIKINMTKLPTEVSAMNIYAVDPGGKVTMLGPVQIANSAGTFTTTTPLTKFMLVASPEASLSAYNETTQVLFRSAVPAGLTVIPITNATGETVGAVAVPTTPTTTAPTKTTTVTVPTAAPTTGAVAVTTTTTDYTVPMLGIGNFKKGDDTKLKIDFTGDMEGARANLFIEPKHDNRLTEVRLRLHELKEAPKGKAFVLWASSPDGQFARLGQVVNVKGRNEAEIKGEVPFDDFGLLLTVEDAGAAPGAIIKPAGQRVGIVKIGP
jgi:hypothetical protein